MPKAKLVVPIVRSPFGGTQRHVVRADSEKTLCGRNAELWLEAAGAPSCHWCLVQLKRLQKQAGVSRKARRAPLQRKQTGARALLTIDDPLKGYTVPGAPDVTSRIEEFAAEMRTLSQLHPVDFARLFQGKPPEFTESEQAAMELDERVRREPSIVLDKLKEHLSTKQGQGTQKSRAELPTRPRRQCKACPWKVSTTPGEDIPGGYCVEKHTKLKNTIAEGIPSMLRFMQGSMHMMACHESMPGEEQPCVGWVVNQLGPGNNLGLRMLARDGRYALYEVDGEQHPTLEATLGEEEEPWYERSWEDDE